MSDGCVERKGRDDRTRDRQKYWCIMVLRQWKWRGKVGTQIITQVKSSGPSQYLTGRQWNAWSGKKTPNFSSRSIPYCFPSPHHFGYFLDIDGTWWPFYHNLIATHSSSQCNDPDVIAVSLFTSWCQLKLQLSHSSRLLGTIVMFFIMSCCYGFLYLQMLNCEIKT